MKALKSACTLRWKTAQSPPSRSGRKMVLAAMLLKTARHKMASPGGRRIFLSSRP